MSTNPFDSLTSPSETNDIIENVLLITLNPEKAGKCILMSEDNETKLWSLELVEMNLFERLMAMAFSGGDEDKVILYLYNSFLRLNNCGKKNSVTDHLFSLIFRNLATALKEPELFPEQNISAQMMEIYKDSELDDTSLRDEFLSTAIKKALEDADVDMKRNVQEIFFKCFDVCLKSVRQASMINLEKWVLTFLTAFSSDKSNPEMANFFIDYIKLPPDCDGLRYADSLLGKWAFCYPTLSFQ